MKIRISFVSNSSSSSFICYGWRVEDEEEMLKKLADKFLTGKDLKRAYQEIDRGAGYIVYGMLPFKWLSCSWGEGDYHYIGASATFSDEYSWDIRELKINDDEIKQVMEILELPLPKLFYGIIAS